MMRIGRRWVGLVALSAVLAGSVEAAVQFGEAAPPLQIARWLTGEPTTLSAGRGEKVYVIDFWAAWTPASRRGVRYLRELHERYHDQGLVIVGVTAELREVERAEDFVAKRAALIPYAIGLDDGRQTVDAYLSAEQYAQLPYAVVVGRDGRVAWAGRTTDDLTPIIEQTLAGEFDLADAEALRAQREQREAQLTQLANMYLQQMAGGEDFNQARSFGEKFVEVAGDDAVMLGALADQLLQVEAARRRDITFALELTTKANKLTGGKDPLILNVHARALFERGRVSDALKTQQAAIAAAQDPDLKAELEALLADYQRRILEMTP